MEEITKWMNGHKKVPKCVAVYDRLFKLINDGVFDMDGKLPTEPALAELMGVSRMTLRQALMLLKEDGIIESIHAKGNFIVKEFRDRRRGLEVMQNPIYSLLKEKYKISKTEIEYTIVEMSDFGRSLFKNGSDKLIYIDRWYKSGNKVLAYTLSILDDESKLNSLSEYLEREIYDRPNLSRIKILTTNMGNIVSTKYKLSKKEDFYLVEEKIIANTGKTLVFNKHYIAIDYANIVLNRR